MRGLLITKKGKSPETVKKENKAKILKNSGIVLKDSGRLDLSGVDLDSFGQGEVKQQQKQQPVQITADTSITSAFPQNEVVNKIKQYKDNPSKEDFQTRNADRLQRLENLNSQLGEAVNTLQQSTDLNIKPNTASKEKINPFSSEQTVYDNWQRALTQYEYNKENAFDNMQKSYLDKNSFANYQLNANPEDLQLTEKKIQQLKERYNPIIVDEFLQTHKILKDEYINGVGQTYKFVPVNPVEYKLQAGNREEYNQLISALEKDRQRISDSKDLSRGDKMAINHLKKLTQELYDAPTKDEGMAITNALEGTYEKSIGDRDFWTAGITELARNYKIENSAERFKNEYQRLAKEYANRGDKNWKEKARDNAFNNLSVSDREKLNAYMDFVEAGKVRKDDLSTAYQIGETIGGSLGFMVNMFLGSGATNLVRNGVRSIAKTSSKKFAKSIVKGIDKQILKDEVVARGINIPANATSGEVWRATGKYFKELGKTALKPGQAIITTAVNPRTYANVAEKKTQKFVQGEDATFGDVAAAVVESHVENWSEVYGGKILSPFFKSVFKGTPFFKQATKLGSEKFGRTAIGKAFNDLRSNKFNQFLRNKGHFGDTLEEFEEEYVGGLATSLYGAIAENIPFLKSEFATDMKSNFSDMFSSDETGMLVGSILPMEILLKGVPLARSFRREMNMMGYNDAVSNLRTVLQNNGYQNADNLISAVETAIATDNVYKKDANGNTTNDFTDDFAELIGATVETFNNTADNNVQSAFNNYLNEAKNVGKYISDNLSFFNLLDEDEKQKYLNDILKEVQQKATTNILYNNLRKAKMYNVFNSETGEYENRVLQIYDKSSGETGGIVTDYDKDSKTFTIIPEYSNSPVQVTMDDFKKNNLGVLHERADVLLDELSQVVESNSKEGSYIHTRLALNDFIEYDGQQAYITEVQDKDGTPYFVKDLNKARQTGGTVGVKTYNPQTNTWDTQIVNVSDLDESTVNRRLFDEFADQTYQTQKDLINQTRQITQELSQSQQQAEQQTQQPQSETTDNNSDLIDSNIIQGNEYDKSYTNNLKAGDKITIHASEDNDNDNIDELDGKQVSVVSLQEGYRNDVRSITVEDTEGNRYDLPVISNNSDWSFTYNGSEVQETSKESAETNKPLSKEQAEEFISQIEQRAEIAPEMELTPENWEKEFGTDGIVNTPVGEVKMGENQYLKLAKQGRDGKLGMIKPTLETPDVIIEDKSKAKDGQTTERESSYIFIKAFQKQDGSRFYYFTSVTVAKDNREVVISNQEKGKSRISNLLQKGNILWKYADDISATSDVGQGLYSDSEEKTSDSLSEGTDAPQSTSESKITTKSLNDKIKSGEILSQNAEDTLVELYSQMSKEDAQEVVNGIIKQAEAKQKQLAKKSINYEDIDKFQKHKQQIKETEKKLAYWNEVKSLFTAPQSQVEEVQNLKSIGEKEKTLGQAYSMREYILRHLVLGGKFIWNDNENGTKGLGSHLGLSNSTEERRNYFAFLAGKDKKGVYPEVYAENLLTDVRENINPNAEFDEVFNEMIDCLSSFSTPTAMMNEAVRLHYETEDDLIQNDFEKQQQEINDSAEEQEISRLTEQQLKENALSPEEYDNLQRQRIEEEQRKTDISTRNEEVKPTFIDVVKALYEKGKEFASNLYKQSFFDVAETPAFMQKLGLTGDKFTIRYGVISRHFGKDTEHNLSEKVWQQLPQAIQNPFAITKYYEDEKKEKQKGYRLYTSLTLSNGSFVVVSAEVKNAGKDIEINAINTIFGRKNISETHDELIYKAKEITPEQEALLNGNNPRQYPSVQELSDSKVTTNLETTQEKNDINSDIKQNSKEIKEKYPNTIPLIAKDNTYTVIGNDAVDLSDILDIELKQTKDGKYFVNIPVKDFEHKYLPEIIKRGKRVAIASLETSKTDKEKIKKGQKYRADYKNGNYVEYEILDTDGVADSITVRRSEYDKNGKLIETQEQKTFRSYIQKKIDDGRYYEVTENNSQKQEGVSKNSSSERNQQNGTSQKTKSNTVTDNVNNYLQTIDNLKRDIVERALQHSTTLNRNGENVKMTVAEYIDYCIRNGIEIEDNGRFRPVVMDYYRWAKDNYIKQQKASDSTQQETTTEDKALLDAVVDKLKEAIGEENVITDNSEAQRILDEANGKERRISEQIKQIFDDVIKGKIKGKPVKIGNLSKDGKAYLEQISGLKFKDNCRFVLNPSDLLHIYNNHFGNNEKDKGNNIPLTMHDIKRIADVISFPTEIIAGQNEQGKNMFYFLMESSNGTYNLLEVYADRNGNLTAKTFYKTKKSVSQRAINLRNSLHSTSSTDGATLSNAKIPQIFDLPNKNTAKQKKINDGLDLRNAIKDITEAKGYGTNSAYVRGTSKNGTTYEIRVGNHIANFENFDRNNEELPQKIVSIVLLDEKFDRKNARFQSSEEINRELDSQNIDCEFEQVIIDDIENKTQEELQQILDNISFSTKVLKERGRLMFEDDSNIRFHKVYHGSGAEFDTFDHSHMGEGEGAQVFGWGSYVTEVEEIGRTYAEQATPIVRYNGSTADTYKNYKDRSVTEDAAIRVMDNFQRSDYDIEQAISLSIEELESYGGDEYSEELDALQQMSADDFDVEIPDHNLYTVEIPDDNGKNYLFWEQDYDENEISSLVKQLSKYDSNDFDFDYLSEKIEDYLDEYNMTGEGLYKLIKRYGFNNNAQKTSELLNKLGLVGISYPTNTLHGGNTDGTRNYVIFNEKDLKITDHVKFFKTKDGQAYGFTANGKIYIDTSIAKADTPIHEYTHLWAEALKQNNPEEWKNIVDLMKKEKILWDKIKQDYPELTTDDELADEVLAHYSGENGKKRLEEEVKNIKANNKQSIFDKAKMVNAVNNVKKALERFWKGVASFFNVHFTSAQDLADTILSDFLNGVNPNENIKEKTDGKVKTDKENNDIRYNKAKPTDNKEFIDDNSTTKDFDERLMDTLTLNFDKEDGDYQQYNRTTTKVANWLEEKVKPLRAVDKGHDSFAGVRLLEQRVRLAKFKKSKSFKETHESPYKALNKAITSAYGIKTAVRNIFIAKNYRAIDNVVGKTITIKGKKVDITRKHVAEYQVIKAMADRTAKIIEDRYQRFTELSAKSKLTKKEQKELDNILSDMGKNFGQDFKAIYDKISNAEVVERFEQMKHKFKSDTTKGISAVMEVQLMDAIKMRMAAEIYRDDFVYNTERNGGFIKGMLSGEQDLFKTELYNLFFKEKEPKGTTHTPQEVINEIESYDLDFDSINKTTNKLIEFINKFSLSSKMIDTEEYNYRQLNGDYWVPLRGWDGEMYSVYGQASGTQKTNIRANGRKTVASDPMPYIYAMVESTVDDGVYSSAKRVLKDYLMRNADILKENDETVTYMYRFYPNENGRKAMNSKRGNITFIEDGETGFVLTDKKPRASWIDNEKSIIHGNTSEITDAEGNKYEHTETGKVEVVAVNEDFNKLNNGLVFKVFGDDKKYERLHNETLQPYIWTFRDTDGTIFRIALPDKSLVKTLNTPKIRFNEAFANPLLRDVAMNVKNLQSKMVTSYSLKFAINNIFKDLPMAMAKEVSNTNGYVGHLFSEFKNIGRVAQYIFNPRGIDINKMSTKDKEVYLSWLEWQTLGGMSGVSSFYNKDVDNVMKRLEADMDRTKWSKAKKVVGLKYVSDCAELGENLIRFASYRAFIKSGLNKNEAAYQSKEVTLNYSRQGKVSQKMNLFYTFYSATMNACYKLARLLINNPKGYFKFFTYFALVGVGKAIISHSSGDDDKDKSKYTSPYKQLRHLYVPFSDGFYIPFPHEAALPFALGQDLTKCLFFDEINGSKVLYDMTQILPEHLPQPYDALLKDMFKYNQTTGNMEISVLSKDYRNRTVSTLSPSAITPLVDDLVLNEDFMGGNIIYDNWNGQEKTRAGRSPSYDNTYIASELLAEGYNKILNWDLMGKNKIDYLDAISDKKGNIVSDSGKLNKLRTLAPEDIQYIAQQYVPYFTGVVGKAVDVGNMVIKKAFGDDAGYKGRDGQGQTLQQAKEETRKDSKVKVPLYDDPIITRAYSTINKEVKRLETKYKDIKEKDLSEVSKQALEKNSEYQAYKTIKRKSKKIRNEAKKIDTEIENLQKSDMPDKKQKVLELQHKKNHLWDNWINDNDLKALKLLPK